MKLLKSGCVQVNRMSDWFRRLFIAAQIRATRARVNMREHLHLCNAEGRERGDVPGWVLVVLMTTGLVTAIWTIAAPRLTAILRNSLDSMNGIR